MSQYKPTTINGKSSSALHQPDPEVVPRAKRRQFRATYKLRILQEASYSSLSPDVRSRAPETAPVYLAPDEPLHLRIFVDKSVVEVFVNGKQCVAVRVYPGRSDSVGVSLRAQGKDAVLKGLDVWQMRNIYMPVPNA